MAILTVADRISHARRVHQDSIRFASEFWDYSDLLTCLNIFTEQIFLTETGAGGPGLEIALSLRRLVTEKCLARWGRKDEENFRKLNDALHHLHKTLHDERGAVTREVRAAALLLEQEIEALILRNST